MLWSHWFPQVLQGNQQSLTGPQLPHWSVVMTAPRQKSDAILCDTVWQAWHPEAARGLSQAEIGMVVDSESVGPGAPPGYRRCSTLGHWGAPASPRLEVLLLGCLPEPAGPALPFLSCLKSPLLLFLFHSALRFQFQMPILVLQQAPPPLLGSGLHLQHHELRRTHREQSKANIISEQGTFATTS